jgi:molybdopterin-guanine dinucleotide biosynthesis protein A
VSRRPCALIAGVILAGGRATRMGGGDKTLLPLGGRAMLAHVVERLAPQVDTLALSANGDPARSAAFALPVLPDPVPGQPGPLAGILAGIDWAAAIGAGALVATPGDTPFLPPDLVARLVAAGGGRRAAFVVTPGLAGPEMHPTTALWPVACRALLRDTLASGERRVRVLAEAAEAVAVEMAADAFANVNTPAELTAAEARLAERG